MAMTYKLQPRCTVADASGVAKNNVSAFWTQTWWRILFVPSQETVLQKVTLRTPQNLLSQRGIKRHQAVVDTDTGEIVGYARWIMPPTHTTEWAEAQTPAVSDADMARFKAQFEATKLPHGEYIDDMIALDIPIKENRERVSPRTPYLTLDYLATHPDHQRRGISSMLVKSGIEQAHKLGIDIMVLAMGDAAVSLYKKHGFELAWELSQSLEPWGHDDVYYTAILIRHPNQGSKGPE